MIVDAPDIYLASASPRRRELLQQIGVRFELVSVAVDEVPLAGESAEAFVARMARDKAAAGWAAPARTRVRPVLGADTVVVVDGEILGKPRHRDHAAAMLERLSGRAHRVLTAVCLVLGERRRWRLSASTVKFAPLKPARIAAYLASGEADDKAGAYAVQGAAAAFIEHISGSYSGIVGLPLFETAELLAELGIVPDSGS